MPHPHFFSNLGLFVVNNFLDDQLCARLRAEMFSSSRTAATVVDGYNVVEINKEEVRRVKDSSVSDRAVALIKERLMFLKPGLESHFDLRLTGCEKPQFLIYEEGDFFLPHRDGEKSEDKPDYINNRKLSVVIFLNGEGLNHAEKYYCGGALKFYGLINDPGWEKYGFPLISETGLLVAFRSGVVHEVTPVTSGKRCTVVSWFF